MRNRSAPHRKRHHFDHSPAYEFVDMTREEYEQYNAELDTAAQQETKGAGDAGGGVGRREVLGYDPAQGGGVVGVEGSLPEKE